MGVASRADVTGGIAPEERRQRLLTVAGLAALPEPGSARPRLPRLRRPARHARPPARRRRQRRGPQPAAPGDSRGGGRGAGAVAAPPRRPARQPPGAAPVAGDGGGRRGGGLHGPPEPSGPGAGMAEPAVAPGRRRGPDAGVAPDGGVLDRLPEARRALHIESSPA